MIYFDNAATSFPKPKETISAVHDFLTVKGGNPGRGGHPLSIDAARVVFETREKLTRFVGGKNSERMIFTQNGTESLNLAILGLLREDDHVVTTALEHNAVMRPLDFLMKERRIEVTIVPCSPAGDVDIKALRRAVRKKTKMVIANHGSNIVGTIQPLDRIRESIGNKLFVVDGCQTVGNIAIDVERDGIDVLCFSCHKALLGIQGLGAIFLREGVDPIPLKFGGTGSRSEETEQPDALPDRYESGTPNTPGIAGLSGGLRFIEKVGIGEIGRRKRAMTEKIFEGLSRLDKVQIYGSLETSRLPIVLMNVEGVQPSDVGYECNRAGICVRVGLHCAPLSHKTVGTFPTGAVRISPGYFTTDEEVERLLQVVAHIIERERR